MATKGKNLAGLVGRNIRHRRLEIGLTQGQVAETLSVEVETVSRYERGVLSPSLAQLERLAQILETPAHLLLSPGGAFVEETAEGLAYRMAALAPEQRAFVAEFIRDYAAVHGQPAKAEASKRSSRRKPKS